MRQINLVLTLLIAITVPFIPATLSAQPPNPAPKAAAEAAAGATRRALASNVESPTQLPVTRVALYKNGVGFFEHSGRVNGSQSVTIDFTTAQLNDVLQSLTAIDLNGGRIAGAGYNSTTPLEQQLRALPLALGQDPNPMELYNAIRGSRVSVTGPGVNVSGRLFNIEVKTVPGKDGQPPTEMRVMTVIGEDGGVRTAQLTPATEVRLLDQDLHQDVTRYLQLLAGNRNQELRHLTLQDNGSGARELRVSYISEVPIWKSTYRILFTDPAGADAKATRTATLQGWSVVDNTTGADWINVHLSLIAGAPQSFIQPLSIPYYSHRPQVGMQMEAQTLPQLHQSGESNTGLTGKGAISGTVTDRNGAVIRNARVTATNTETGAQTTRGSSGTGYYSLSPLPPGNYNVEVVAPGFQRLLQQNVRVNSQQNAGVNLKLTVGGESTTVTVTAAPPFLETANATIGGTIENELYANLPLSKNAGPRDTAKFQYTMPGVQEGPPPTSSGGQAQGMYGGSGLQNMNENFIQGIPVSNLARGVAYEEAARNSLLADSTTSAFDDYFEYKIGEPVTIRKNESAMVPILQAKIDAERVTLWGPQHPTPLRALWVTNTSSLTLDRGSFSIVEDGNFGGEGLLDPIHPAEKRLLSYAVDQAVRVSTEPSSESGRVTSVTAAKGVLILHNTAVTAITYVVHNAAPEARTVVIEHPIHQGYELDSADSSATPADGSGTQADSNATPAPKPSESTPTLYRYRVVTDPGATVRLHVAERCPTTMSYQLTNSNDSQFAFIMDQTNRNPKVEAALQPILDARRRAADAQVALDAVNARLTDLRSDEERQRDNVTALASADKSSRERFVHDLNATEDQIAVAQKELIAAQTTLQSAMDDLAGKIESLQLDQAL